MAFKKISDLTVKVAPADTDELELQETANSSSKKATLRTLVEAIVPPTFSLTDSTAPTYNDEFRMQLAGGGASRKVKLSRLGPGVMVFPSGDPTGVLDVTNIQAALNEFGLVTLARRGTYHVNQRLVIYSNTTLHLTSGVVIRQISQGAACGNMLVNNGYFSALTNITMSWTAGLLASVGWTAHGKIVGDWISVVGVTPSHYIGVFRISSITDANNFVIEIYRMPSVGPSIVSGSIQAKLADVNISITGEGKFDYGYLRGNNSLTGLLNHAVILGHVHNVNVNFQGQDVPKFVCCLGAINAFQANVGAQWTSSDMIKIYGPANNGHARAYGKSGDDLISVHTREPTAYAQYRWTYGDCLGISVVADGNCGNSGGPAVIYPSQNEYMDNITVRIRSGSDPNTLTWGSKVWGDPAAGAAGGNVGTVTYTESLLTGNMGILVQDVTIKKLVVDKSCQFNPANVISASHVVDIRGTAIVGKVVCEASVNNTAWPVASASMVHTVSGCVVKSIYVSSELNCSAFGELVRVTTGSSVEKITIEKCVHQTLVNNCVIVESGAVGVTQVTFANNDIYAYAMMNASSDVVVLFTGNAVKNALNGMVRTGGTPNVKMYSGGGNQLLTSTVWVVVPSGTPVISVYGNDINLDIGGTGIAKTNGTYCFNTGAARGTIVQNRLVLCDGTLWYQANNLANTF